MSHGPTRVRYETGLPFQVFSCWNGISVMKAEPFLPPHRIRFRSLNGTSTASESYLLPVDFWKSGFNRIMVVPTVQLAYTLKEYIAFNSVRQLDGQRPASINLTAVAEKESVDWRTDPPTHVEWYPYNKHFNRPAVSDISKQSGGYLLTPDRLQEAIWFPWDYEPQASDMRNSVRPKSGEDNYDGDDSVNVSS